MQPKATAQALHDVTDTGGAHGAFRCSHLDEQGTATRRDPAMAILEVAHDCLTDVFGDREKLLMVAFSPDRDFTVPPVDVIDPQPGHLTAAQSQPPQNRQDRAVA